MPSLPRKRGHHPYQTPSRDGLEGPGAADSAAARPLPSTRLGRAGTRLQLRDGLHSRLQH